MSLTLANPAFEHYRIASRSAREGGAQVFTARGEGQVARSRVRGDAWARLVLLPGLAGVDDAARILEQTSRYALGTVGLALPLGVRWLADSGPNLPASTPAKSLLVGYEAHEVSLDVELLRSGALSHERVAVVLEQLALALGALHDQGIAHGQLRADLVGLADDGVVELAGFGVGQLALALGGPRYARDLIPTEYRAAELRQELPARAETGSDVYALGVIASEMLAGRRAPATLSVPTPRALGARVDASIELSIARALRSSVAERPSDIRAWVVELSAALRAAPEPFAWPAATSNALERGRGPASNRVELAGSTFVPDSPPALPTSPANQVLPASPPPGALAPEIPGAAGRERKLPLFAGIALVLGVLLMCGGLGSLFAYSSHESPNASGVAGPLADAGPKASGGPTTSSTSSPPGAPSGKEPQAETEAVPGTDAGSLRDGDEHKQGPGLARVQPQDFTAVLPLDVSVPVWGVKDALVTIVVFGDLECPYTRRTLNTLRRLKTYMRDELRIAWRHRPLPIHTHAESAAEAAAAVHAEYGNDAFWKFLEQAARTRNAPTSGELKQWLTTAGANGEHLTRRLATNRYAERVARDLELAGRYDVRATPTFFVNGIRRDGARSFAELRVLVEHERKAALSALAAGTPRPGLYAARANKNFINVGSEIVERNCPKVDGSPARGPAAALVTIVEFSDFQCAHCKNAQRFLSELEARHGANLRRVWKNFPLEQHPYAESAAAFSLQLFEEHGEQIFWRGHGLLFKASPELDDQALARVATRLGLDADALLEAVQRGDQAARLSRDLEQAREVGVTGTPTFFVNGRMLRGVQSLASFQTLVEQELGTARRLLSQGVARKALYGTICADPEP